MPGASCFTLPGEGLQVARREAARDVRGFADVIGLVLPRGFEAGVVLGIEFLERFAVLVHRGRAAPGVFAVEQDLLVGERDFLCDRRLRDAPETELGVERFGGGDLRVDLAGELDAAGVAHDAVNPGVGHLALDDRDFGILLEDGVHEIVHRAHADLHAGEFLRRFVEERLDLVGLGRTGVVRRHDDGGPDRVGPIGRGREARADEGILVAIPAGQPRRDAGAVGVGIEGQHARAVGAFPPEEAGRLHAAARPVAADVHELHAAVGQHRGERAAVRRHIGHLAGTRQRHSVLAAEIGSEDEAARHLLRFAGIGFERERQRVELELAGLHVVVEPLPAGGRLAIPIFEHLRHDPARAGPGELLLRRQALRLVHDVHRLVDHVGAVVVDDLLHAVRVADVEVGLDDDDDLAHRGRLRGVARRKNAARQQGQAEEAQISIHWLSHTKTFTQRVAGGQTLRVCFPSAASSKGPGNGLVALRFLRK